MDERIMVSIQGLKKSFRTESGFLEVLNGVSLDIYEKEFICILGYSGCGKSTLLRILSALEVQDSGVIIVDGLPHTAPNKEVMMLFQDFNQLFPWKTVLKNVMYPMEVLKLYSGKEEIKEGALNLLRSVGLSDFADSYPHQLSGGMKQRAAVARALAVRPKVLLMDEPFAALDAVTRTHLQKLTRQICTEHGVTVLFVTHSVEEAVLLGDRIVIMSREKHGVDHIIENRDHGGDTKESRTRLIAEIIEYMDQQRR